MRFRSLRLVLAEQAMLFWVNFWVAKLLVSVHHVLCCSERRRNERHIVCGVWPVYIDKADRRLNTKPASKVGAIHQVVGCEAAIDAKFS